MSTFEGLDGAATADDQGVTFTRSRMRRLGRGDADPHVPWSVITGAHIERTSGASYLRISIAGRTAPKTQTADPYAIAVKRNGAEDADVFVQLVHERCAGDAAVAPVTEVRPEVEEAPALELPAAAPSQAPQPVYIPDKFDRRMNRMFRIAEIGFWLQLFFLLLPLLLIIAVVVWILVKL